MAVDGSRCQLRRSDQQFRERAGKRAKRLRCVPVDPRGGHPPGGARVLTRTVSETDLARPLRAARLGLPHRPPPKRHDPRAVRGRVPGAVRGDHVSTDRCGRPRTESTTVCVYGPAAGVGWDRSYEGLWFSGRTGRPVLGSRSCYGWPRHRHHQRYPADMNAAPRRYPGRSAAPAADIDGRTVPAGRVVSQASVRPVRGRVAERSRPREATMSVCPPGGRGRTRRHPPRQVLLKRGGPRSERSLADSADVRWRSRRTRSRPRGRTGRLGGPATASLGRGARCRAAPLE